MSDLTVEIADKIELHLVIDTPGADLILTEEDQRIIIDCLRTSTPKSGEIERLQALVELMDRQLAEVDGLVATHASAIDSNMRSKWPKGSILEAALSRHEKRASLTSEDNE